MHDPRENIELHLRPLLPHRPDTPPPAQRSGGNCNADLGKEELLYENLGIGLNIFREFWSDFL